ncbi:conserved hypothetical protein [uncultured Gammaproteobacteria bacterium]
MANPLGPRDSLPEVTLQRLIGLGGKRLARLLLDHADRDEALAQRLRLLVAMNTGPDCLIAVADARIRDLAGDRDQINAVDSAQLAAGIDDLRRALAVDLVARAPRTAADLLRGLVRTAGPVLERVDDGSGMVADAYVEVIAAWGRAWAAIADRDPATVAALVAEALRLVDAGLRSELVPAFREALGPNGLALLRRLMLNDLETLSAEEAADQRMDAYALLQQIADALGDVDGFIQAVILCGEQEIRAPAVAERLLAAGRAVEALAWLDKATDLSGGEPSNRSETVDLRITALQRLNRTDEAQATRWLWFARTLSLAHFHAFIEALPESGREPARRRGVAAAERHDDVSTALSFLVVLREFEAAEGLILKRRGELDGRRYFALEPLAEQLAAARPLAALLLYRVMAEAVLIAAQSKAYHHAARYFRQAQRLARAVADWRGQERHETFLARLRTAHPRKRGFWSEVSQNSS